ncbi:hypothetical protein D9615_007054 [Tricholomella constricta]|uniref:Uncharacterized protein n=1 Tax=Tricholomella constricta TaxID=117010 RepID=A0A8H5H8E2_9AGAR|nr:hypothetical protein D9615_007054 [Tricholomella constricta]
MSSLLTYLLPDPTFSRMIISGLIQFLSLCLLDLLYQELFISQAMHGIFSILLLGLGTVLATTTAPPSTITAPPTSTGAPTPPGTNSCWAMTTVVPVGGVPVPLRRTVSHKV